MGVLPNDGRPPGAGPPPRRGRVSSYVAAEFPGLGVSWVEVDGGVGKSDEGVQQRLRRLSDRFYGAQAIQMREQPIPWAYRVFYRHIGLDPDRTRTPVEQLALERLKDGAFAHRGLPADALTIAMIETGVALRAFDADRLQGPLGIRESVLGESLWEDEAELPRETLVLTDDLGAVGLLFGATAPGYEVGPRTERVAVAAVEVKGVPAIAVEEALWIASSELTQP
jgi:DNA/RNA-binding domain of Phe-tRNA-synthetase-like protein